jgi:hypothetical protein
MWLNESPIRFAIRALLVYGALVLPGMLLRDAYSSGYRGAANVALYAAGLNDRAALRPLEEPDGTVDSQIVLFDRASGAFVRRSVTPWRQGFLPTAAVAALVLATKLPWRRRLKALAIGLIAINIFVALRLTMSLLSGMNGTAPWCIINLSPTAGSVLNTTEMVFVHTTTFAYVVAALVWLGVAWPIGGGQPKNQP